MPRQDARARRAANREPPEPTEAVLHEAALAYLSRYAATQAALLRVLDRRITRWAGSSAADQDRAREARQAARRVAARLVESGAVNDGEFAHARANRLRLAGKSRRAIGAHLASKGVSGPMLAEHAGGDTDEIGSAAIHARRRRLGPFRVGEETPETRMKELAALARAGFAHGTAEAALRLSREEAEALIIRYRKAAG